MAPQLQVLGVAGAGSRAWRCTSHCLFRAWVYVARRAPGRSVHQPLREDWFGGKCVEEPHWGLGSQPSGSCRSRNRDAVWGKEEREARGVFRRSLRPGSVPGEESRAEDEPRLLPLATPSRQESLLVTEIGNREEKKLRATSRP